MEKQAPDLTQSNSSSRPGKLHAEITRPHNLVSRLEASRGTSGEYRVPWERGFYVETVVFLAEFLLAYKEMVYVRFLM